MLTGLWSLSHKFILTIPVVFYLDGKTGSGVTAKRVAEGRLVDTRTENITCSIVPIGKSRSSNTMRRYPSDVAWSWYSIRNCRGSQHDTGNQTDVTSVAPLKLTVTLSCSVMQRNVFSISRSDAAKLSSHFAMVVMEEQRPS